ncbi:MAG: hypothetical protein KGZ92_10695 [Firmicutes bacterium]|nr:hypothetical protein [Dethiobacter sp.]MBS3889735.1 hypothetical protein [Bacillota bacterium]MBS4053941.1 hypothetical protein [Thermaerobacter sp.]
MRKREEVGRHTDSRIAVVEEVGDVEETEKPFGKRWHHEAIVLRAEHLAALREGKALAVDVREEYVVFVRLDDKVAMRLKELEFGE